MKSILYKTDKIEYRIKFKMIDFLQRASTENEHTTVKAPS